MRFHNCAWVCRANAFGANPGGPVWDRPLRRRETVFVIRRRGGSQTRPLKPSPSKGEGVWPEARRMRVLSWYAHPPAGGPRASPTQTRKICGKPVRLGRATARVAPTGLQEHMQGPETPGGPVCRPYGNRETSQDTPSPEPHLSPTSPKGALPSRRSATQRLPDTQRQR